MKEIDQALGDLALKRERIKKELLEKQAQQANEHHRYIAFGGSRPPGKETCPPSGNCLA